MKRLLLAFVLLLQVALAYAAAPLPPQNWWFGWSKYATPYDPTMPLVNYRHKSAIDACYNMGGNWTNGTSGSDCMGDGAESGTLERKGMVYAKYGTKCADGSLPDTTKEPSKQCADPTPECTSGKSVSGTVAEGSSKSGTANFPDGGMKPMPSSFGGCNVTPKTVERCYSTANATGGKDFFCKYTFEQTGTVTPQGTPTTQPAPAPSPTTNTTPESKGPTQAGDDPSDTCPEGTSRVGTDSSGIAMCAGSGTNPQTKDPAPVTEKPPTTTNNPDGSTTTVKESSVKNGDGSTTTTTTTTVTKPDGTKTTSVKTTTSAATNGSDGRPDAPTDPDKSDLCKLRPELNICRNSSISGSCSAVACSGDAITCEIARQASVRNCEEKAKEDALKASAQYALGNAAMSGADPLASSLPDPSKPTEIIAPSSISSGGFLGGGSCFPDTTFAIQGMSVTVPWSSACQYLIGLRAALMAVALMLAFRMVSGTILRE